MCRRLGVILILQQRQCQSLKCLSGHWWSRTADEVQRGVLGELEEAVLVFREGI